MRTFDDRRRDRLPVCYSKAVRHTSGELKAMIYREYRLDKSEGHFEVDHLISLELGGVDVAENLWSQSYDTAPWNAHTKDKLEDRLRAVPAGCRWSRRSARLPRTGSQPTRSMLAPRRPIASTLSPWFTMVSTSI
jgi:hypothetical protein